MPEFPLSERIRRVAPSLTMAITQKARELRAAGVDVIGLGAGEPDFDTPEPIKQAAIAAIEAGATKYTAVDGIPELKAAIAEHYVGVGLRYEPAQIAVTVGAKQAIYNLLQVALDPGDGVLIPSPYWVSYPEQVRLAGGEPQIVPTDPADGFRLRPAALAEAIRPNSKLLILNSPCNPTGTALTREELEAIAAVALEHDLWIISDEIYDQLVYDGFRPVSVATLAPELYERTAVVNGVSKTYAMTGWRIGWVVGPAGWVRAAVKLQGQSTSNPTSIAQHAALAALRLDPGVVEEMRRAFERRRDLVVAELGEIPGVRCARPQGAFYLFVDVREAIAGRWSDTLAFAATLLEEAHVAVVPGEGFGAPGFVRISYATSEAVLREAIARIRDFLA